MYLPFSSQQGLWKERNEVGDGDTPRSERGQTSAKWQGRKALTQVFYSIFSFIYLFYYEGQYYSLNTALCGH
jgi:hypothetical protein